MESKVRKLISVNPVTWGEIKVAAMLRCESIGDYLVGLHLGKTEKKEESKVIPEKVIKQDEIKKQEIKKPPIPQKEESKDMSLEERREWAYKQMKKGRG